MEEFLQVGVITSPHGVHGEVKVYPTTDDVHRFDKLKEVYLENGKEKKLLHVRSVKYFKNMVIVGFKEYTTMNDVEVLRQCPLLVDREHAVALDEGEYFVADLLGMNVISDDNKYSGVLSDVLETGANDVYEITLSDNKRFLLPAIKECIVSVDIENKNMVIHILPGLL